MSRVTPIPPGGMTTEIGTIASDLQAVEAARIGAAYAFTAASVSIPAETASTWLTPTGFPSLEVTIAAGGGALAICGFTFAFESGTSSTPAAGISVDGATPTVTGQGPLIFSPAPANGTPFCSYVTQVFSGLTMGYHTFSVAVYVTGTQAATTASSPWLAVLPL